MLKLYSAYQEVKPKCSLENIYILLITIVQNL